MDYMCLTKKIKDTKGEETVRCVFYGTEKCFHPDTYHCSDCEMMQMILNQLFEFEKVYKGCEE